VRLSLRAQLRRLLFQLRCPLLQRLMRLLLLPQREHARRRLLGQRCPVRFCLLHEPRLMLRGLLLHPRHQPRLQGGSCLDPGLQPIPLGL